MLLNRIGGVVFMFRDNKSEIFVKSQQANSVTLAFPCVFSTHALQFPPVLHGGKETKRCWLLHRKSENVLGEFTP